ncbi:MFS transporter, YNFM family, putative membrane transport protein [Halopseudomonas xinjiangensis]|uniref:MFS transporter, YNFM family, putative membrane transport protein n=1 Tax=Halopseudomonas xinjiangensis TaxID=487184 RepID=A0A1H1TH79_9GAMM|nr:MFS transporter [Halopseudomonas xinjiangensis]SDS59534.1 MFS transporter, YNFM family, putative membrane transport protein [Halopseudomonas xinjiangensis]
MKKTSSCTRIEAGSADYRRACLALVVASLVIFANLYAIHPLLPQIASEFGVSELQAGSAFTVTSFTLGLSLLIHGPVSDAVGRKLPLLIGLAGTSLLTLAMAFVEDFATLIALRAALGFALGVLPAVAIAYLGDTMTRAALVGAVGLYISGNTLGGSGGRLLGGFIGDHFSLSTVFVCMGSAGLLGLIIVARLLPKERDFSPGPLSLAGSVQGFAMHMRNPALLPAFALGGLNFMIFLNLYTYLTFRLSGPPWSLGSGWLGLLFLTYLAGTFSATLSGRVPFPNIIRGMAAGVALLIIGSLMTLGTSLWLIIAGLLLNAFGFFLTHSLANTWVNQKAGAAKASAASLYSVSYYFGAALGIYYLEIFWQAGRWPAVVAAGVVILAINLGLIRYMRRHL